MGWRIVREYKGTKGYLFFDDKKMAENFLNSEQVCRDKEDGFHFELLEDVESVKRAEIKEIKDEM